VTDCRPTGHHRRGDGGAQVGVARSGLALLSASSELEETIGLCDRVLIMYDGRAVHEFAKDDATKTDVAYSVSRGDGVAQFSAIEPGV